MTNLEKLQQEFQSKYVAWVETRALIDGMDNPVTISKKRLEIRNHAWLEYVLARNTLLKELKNVR